VTEAAREGDHAAREVLTRAGRHLGVALAGFANTFDPDVIVIGGGVAEGAGDLLLDPARAELRDRALPPMRDVPVKAAELGGDAGMYGAAAMAMEENELAIEVGTEIPFPVRED
jgi:glucokinase